MEFKNSQSYRCFQCVCLWSLLFSLLVFLSFFISFAFSFVYPNWGYVGWIVPLLAVVFFSLCIAVATGYLAFTIYFEYRKHEPNLPLAIVIKTEEFFNKILKNNTVKNIIFFISILSYILYLSIIVLNLSFIILSLITFGILFVIYQKNRNNLC